MSTTLPITFSTVALSDAPAYPHAHARPAEPTPLPWPLKSFGSATCGIERLPDGRLSHWIRHEVLRGVTPSMLAWWFANLEGDVLIDGRRINRYRAWHPYDHVHASYARRLPDGSIGPGAAIRLREYLGANAHYEVDIVTDIEKLDEEGYVHNPRVHGIAGLVRMEYRFRRVAQGTQCWRRGITPLLQRWHFDRARGLAWLRHNIEEVGQLERFLPRLYREETGLDE